MIAGIRESITQRKSTKTTAGFSWKKLASCKLISPMLRFDLFACQMMDL